MSPTAAGPETGPERRRDLPMIDVLVLQGEACARAGSALYERLLGAIADDVAAGGVCAEILDPWAENALADAIPLRFLAAVHAAVLRGDAPDLARFYPSAGGADAGDPTAAFLAHVRGDRAAIDAAMHLGVQTNEVGRAAALVGGFHRVAIDTGLPLRCLEVGASAGLLLRWDHYGYAAEGVRWGDPAGLRFDDPWIGAAPELAPDLAVAERRGCDMAPIDVATDAGVTRLRSFLWPDQVERRARLDRAIEVARRVPVTIDAVDAGAWVEAMLAEARPGVATVIHHSIVLQYLPRESFRRMRAAIRAAGAAATPEAPVAWLRMEPAGEVADVRLARWPAPAGEPDDVVLATTGYHGPPVNWWASPRPASDPAGVAPPDRGSSG